jgi:hypothetical protein
MLTGTALILSANSVLAQWKWNLGFAPEYFYWQENDGGAKLLDESGLRYGLDLSGKQIQIESWLWAADFKIYYGSVDYNGQTMGGTPLKSTTGYIGGSGEMRFGYRWSLARHQRVELMGGFGFEDWTRSLNGPGGYTENWLPIYFKAGLELTPDPTGWIGTVGVNLYGSDGGSFEARRPHVQSIPWQYAESLRRFGIPILQASLGRGIF